MKNFGHKNFAAKLTVFLLLLTSLSLNSHALAPEQHLPDEALEKRAVNLFLQVRCLVCSGQVIESSNTEFSLEMRQLIRKKIAAKKSDEEIKNELIKEFGEDILVEPTNKNSALLFTIPALFGAALAGFYFLTKTKSR